MPAKRRAQPVDCQIIKLALLHSWHRSVVLDTITASHWCFRHHHSIEALFWTPSRHPLGFSDTITASHWFFRHHHGIEAFWTPSRHPIGFSDTITASHWFFRHHHGIEAFWTPSRHPIGFSDTITASKRCFGHHHGILLNDYILRREYHHQTYNLHFQAHTNLLIN